MAYRHLQQEKELASDDLALQLTHRPLGLASALAKVWQKTVQHSSFSSGSAFVGMEACLETRVTRLLFPTAQTNEVQLARWQSLAGTVLALVGLLLIETAMMSTILAMMGCGPFLPLIVR